MLFRKEKRGKQREVNKLSSLLGDRMNTITLGVILTIIWLFLNLWYIDVTVDDLIDWLYLKGIDVERRRFIKWSK